jgi:hypothetical protein
VPERYAWFARCDWPGNLTCEEAVEFWHQARKAWAAEHQYEWLGYTTSPLGDCIDLLKAERGAWLTNCCTPASDDANGHGGR